jgi:uncharacterized protein
MARDSITFISEGHKLFGVIHRPDTPGKYPGVVVYHGFLGSKDQPHRMFVELAEALAAAGFVVLRFDLRGRGDSEGDSVDMTWRGDLADAQAGLNQLASLPDVDENRLVVLGMSWGGILAPVIAGQDERVRAVVIWSAVPVASLDWKPDFTVIDGREVAENFAMLVGRQFYDTLPEFRPLDMAKNASSPVLLIYGSDDDQVNPQAVERFRQAMTAPVEARVIEGGDHIFFRYVWKQSVIAQTVDWLKAVMDVGQVQKEQ